MAKNLTNNLTFWSHCLQVDGSGHSEQIAESFSRLQLFTKGCVNLSIKYFYRRRLLQLEQRFLPNFRPIRIRHLRRREVHPLLDRLA